MKNFNKIAILVLVSSFFSGMASPHHTVTCPAGIIITPDQIYKVPASNPNIYYREYRLGRESLPKSLLKEGFYTGVFSAYPEMYPGYEDAVHFVGTYAFAFSSIYGDGIRTLDISCDYMKLEDDNYPARLHIEGIIISEDKQVNKNTQISKNIDNWNETYSAPYLGGTWKILTCDSGPFSCTVSWYVY